MQSQASACVLNVNCQWKETMVNFSGEKCGTDISYELRLWTIIAVHHYHPILIGYKGEGSFRWSSLLSYASLFEKLQYQLIQPSLSLRNDHPRI